MIRFVFYALFLVASLFVSRSYADVTEIDNDKLEQLRANGVAIVDVRRQDEWEHTGVIAGSHRFTFFDEKGRYDAKAWLEKLDAVVEPDQPVVLICARGVRSAKIADLLDKRLGYTHVHNVTKGIVAWLGEKRPVEKIEP